MKLYFTAKKALPIVYGENNSYTNKGKYTNLVQKNPFDRDVQIDFKHWKTMRHTKVMQLGGPRQVGKTTEILKFAYKNYRDVIYVNMAKDDFNFEEVLRSANMVLSMYLYCNKASFGRYRNDSDTILIIDEIQTSRSVYNSIRKMRACLNCDIVVTGSYLGITFHKKGFFLPAGTIDYIDMLPMSFKEVARVFGLEDDLMSIDIYGKGNKATYNKLNKLYEVYRKIGGYPEVIKTYLRTKNITECYNTVSSILRLYKDESKNYFEQPREVDIFEAAYNEALTEMCRERRGTGKDTVEIITKLSKKNTNMVVNKNEIANAVSWLEYTGILDNCDLAVEGSLCNIVPNRRIYFCDCGIVSYIASKSNLAKSSLEGIITETFVFTELHRLFKEEYTRRRVIHDRVCFSTYENYELDFIISDTDKIVYGIEAKTKDGDPLSLRVFKDKHFIDRGILARPSAGGHGVHFDTIPIYTVGCRFPYN